MHFGGFGQREHKTNDEVVAKYGIEKVAAQRDVDVLMNGRSLKA